MPSPGLRWGSVWLAPDRVAGGLVGADFEEKIEHARVGGPGGQGGDRVAGPGLVQRPQQLGDGLRVVEPGDGPPGVKASVAGGPGGQGGDCVAGPGLVQRPQQPGDPRWVVEADVAGGVAGQQGGDQAAGPGLVQRPQQLGDGPRVVEAGVAGGVGPELLKLRPRAK